MNTRIHELATESGLLFQRNKLYYEEQTFAQRIVDDCIRLAEEYNNDATLQRTFSLWDYIHTSMKMPSNVGVSE